MTETQTPSPTLRLVPTGAPVVTSIGLKLNMSAADTMEALRAERRAAKAARQAR